MKHSRLQVLCVCGARPNFMKVAPLLAAFRATGGIDAKLVHTGQHYDAEMSALFFDQLGIPRPEVNLEVGSGSHAVQTAEVMKRFEPLLNPQMTQISQISGGNSLRKSAKSADRHSPLGWKRPPDWVIVVGDVNSTLACALVAAKLGVKVAHVEAGLRSFDRSMPEEINRVLTDALSDLLFVSEPSGVENLRREGIPEERIRFVGNVMIDTLLQHRRRADESTILHDLELVPGEYVTVTLHRPSNVDHPGALALCIDALEGIARDLPVIFPIHPRTRQKLIDSGLLDEHVASPLVGGAHLRKSAKSADHHLRLIPPLGYLDFLKLMSHSAAVLTDSGGIQEETTILGVPCLTLRPNTERPITLTSGTNRLVPLDPAAILDAFRAARSDGRATRPRPPLWDGCAAERIAAQLLEWHTQREFGDIGQIESRDGTKSVTVSLAPANDWVGRVVDVT